MTVGGKLKIYNSRIPGWEYVSQGVAGTGIYGTLSVPALTGFTWVNQGTATATDLTNKILWNGGAGNLGEQVRGLVKGTISAPYTITVGMNLMLNGNSLMVAGLLLRDSGSGKLLLFGYRSDNQRLVIYRYSSPTGLYDQPLDFNQHMVGTVFLKVVDDTANRIFYTSPDKIAWTQLYSQTTADYVSPDQYGFGQNNYAGTYNCDYTVIHLDAS